MWNWCFSVGPLEFFQVFAPIGTSNFHASGVGCNERMLIHASFTTGAALQLTSFLTALHWNRRYLKRRQCELDSLALSFLHKSALTFSGEARLLNQVKTGPTEKHLCDYCF
jgi:hypothetical protein